ncbi:hypothetical protein LCGC14_0727330 [marine sediment metagenome]|uniref:Phage-like element PBSX protein XkdF domain-containing protein n=1 Tax=marine sediment metagenome TaxID=412755 RepID=A0A0F9QAQ0_9ZZZZ
MMHPIEIAKEAEAAIQGLGLTLRLCEGEITEQLSAAIGLMEYRTRAGPVGRGRGTPPPRQPFSVSFKKSDRTEAEENVASRAGEIVFEGYVCKSSGHYVVRDDYDTPTHWGPDTAQALMALLDEPSSVKLEFNPEASAEDAVFDIRSWKGDLYLAPVEGPEPASAPVEGPELAFRTVTKAADKRYTFGVVYLATDKAADPVLDTHEEFVLADDLQIAQWDYVRKGNRNIYLQHGDASTVIGEIVDIVAWPFEVSAEFTAGTDAQTVVVPANSIWMGVIWTEEAWPLIKDGSITGLSMGGWSRRLKA